MYLGIDFGKKRIGLALGQIIPKGAGIIDATLGNEFVISELKKICDENDVEKIVIGLPRLASGDFGVLEPEIRKFAENVKEAINLPIFFEEEQYTSSEAELILKESGKSYDRKSGKVDELAAVLVLEQFLNHEKDEKNN